MCDKYRALFRSCGACRLPFSSHGLRRGLQFYRRFAASFGFLRMEARPASMRAFERRYMILVFPDGDDLASCRSFAGCLGTNQRWLGPTAAGPEDGVGRG